MLSCERSSYFRSAAHRDIFAVTVSLGAAIDFGADKKFSLCFHLDVLGILEGQEGHEVSVMHDESLGGALDQVALGGVRGNDVADRVWNSALQRQCNSGERMPQGL